MTKDKKDDILLMCFFYVAQLKNTFVINFYQQP